MLTPLLRTAKVALGVALIAVGAATISSAPAEARQGPCDPPTPYCQDLPYASAGGCTGTICDTQSQFCCL